MLRIEESRVKSLMVFLLIFLGFTPLVPMAHKAFGVLVLLVFSLLFIKRVHKGKLFFLLAMLSLFIAGAFLDIVRISGVSGFSILNFYFPLCFILGYIISERITTDEYLVLTHKTIIIFAALSLIGVALYTFFPALVYRLPTYVNRHTVHHTAFIFNVLTIGNQIVPRNAGIAWEPGAFQFLLNIGLYAYMKYAHRYNIWIILLYVTAIVTTRSTAGLIILGVNLIPLFLYKQKDRKLQWILVVSVLLSLGSILDTVSYHMLYKLNLEVVGFNVRYSPVLNIIETTRHQIFGIGNSLYDAMYKEYNLGSFDSYTQIFVRYGYLMLIAVVSRILKLTKSHFPLFVIIILTFTSQSLWFFPFVTPFYFMEFRNTPRRKL
jgi:hypothetical protein